MKKTFYISTFLLGLSTIVHAQVPVISEEYEVSPKFFIAIIAGVIIALAFQFILTALSVALGVTAIGDIREKFVKASNHTYDTDDTDDEFNQDYTNNGPNMGVKITSAFGLWSVITTSIALFGATAIALNLSILSSPQTSMTMGLVIWALFFIILFYLEARIANTIVGGLISTATSGLRASTSAIKQMIAPSDSQKLNKVVSNTIDKVKNEFDSNLDMSQLSNTLDSFLTRVDKKLPDYDQLRSDLETIAKKSSNKNTSGKWMAIQQVLTKAISESSSDTDPNKQDKVSKIKDLLTEVQQKYNAGENKEEGIKNILEEYTSMDRQEIDAKVKKIKETISASSPEDVDSANFKDTLMMILNDPKIAYTLIADNYKSFDKDSVLQLLSNNTKYSKEELDGYATKISEQVSSITSKLNKDHEDSFIKQIEQSVANFFNGTERDELNYDELKSDVIKMLDSPSDSVSIVKNRVRQFDANTVRSLVTNNRYVDDRHIDKIISSISEGKGYVQDKVAKIETKARQQIEMAKRKAVIQAEHTRKTAASAAWWLVITAVLSAGAAIGGSLLA